MIRYNRGVVARDWMTSSQDVFALDSLKLKNFLANIGLGSRTVLGVDIGSSSIKICELVSARNSYKLKKFLVEPLPEGSFFGDEIQKREEIIGVLEKMIDEMKASVPFVCAGVWGSNVISKRIRMGAGSGDEFATQVEWECEQYLPFGIDDSTISFDMIGKKNEQEDTVEIIFCAVKTEVSENFQSMIEEAGLLVKIIENSQFALANIFSHVCEKELVDAVGSVVLMEIGANITNIIIFYNSELVFTREISIGGRGITDEIQK